MTSALHLEGDFTTHGDLIDGRFREIGDPRVGEVFFKLGLLRHEDLLVLLGHLVFGVFLQVAVLTGRGDGLGVFRNLLGNDGFVFVVLTFVAITGNQEGLFLAFGISCDQRLDCGEDFNEAREERLLGELFEALVEHQRVGQIASRFRIGG